jgi:hypothetical protein
VQGVLPNQSCSDDKAGEHGETSRLLGNQPGTKGWRTLLDSGKVANRYNVFYVEQRPCPGPDEGEDDDDEEEEI